jgi:hypothetical protein
VPNRTLFYQHHCGSTENRLGRAHHYKQRIFLHGLAIGNIHKPMCLKVHYLATTSNASNSALNSACVDTSLYNIVNVIQLVCSHADFFGAARQG